MDEIVTDLDFGFYANLDFGDLPDSYKTLLTNEGAHHTQGSLTLGSVFDAEGDGQPETYAGANSNDGDDGDGTNDDDGILRNMDTPKWTNGANVPLTVTVSGGTGRVVGWFDWDGDGFDEMVDFGTLSAGTHIVTITVPSSANYTQGNPVNVRFRLFDPNALPGGRLDYGDYIGAATDGEVEDYWWDFGPNAVTLTGFTADNTVLRFCLLIPASGISKQVGWRKHSLRPRICIDEGKANEAGVDAGGKHDWKPSIASEPSWNCFVCPSSKRFSNPPAIT